MSALGRRGPWGKPADWREDWNYRPPKPCPCRGGVGSRCLTCLNEMAEILRRQGAL